MPVETRRIGDFGHKRGFALVARTFNRGDVRGKTLVFTGAKEEDAAFIVSLRLAKGQYLSATSPAVADQVAWLRRYAAKSDEAYFIIRSLEAESLGVVRLYDPQGESFCWGSWILKDGAPASAAIESALMVYQIALGMGFTRSHFEVDRHNEKVWTFHERFGAKRVRASDREYFYEIDKHAILLALERYAKFIAQLGHSSPK